MGLLLVAAICVACFIALTTYLNKKRREYLLAKYNDADVVDKIMRREIWQGMSEAQLLDSWGMPTAKDQKLYKTKTTEIFKYNQTGKNRFASRVRVENGIVVGWEQK